MSAPTYRLAAWVSEKPDWAELTQEQIDRLKKDEAEANEHNSAIYHQKMEGYRYAVKILVDLHPREKVAASLKKWQPSSPNRYWPDEIDRKVKEAKEAKQKMERAKIQDATLIVMQGKAVLWLQERRKKLGEDFQVSDAIQIANDISFEEEVAKRRSEGGLISFSGDDNCENCGGWDMASHRCDCGNRRVSWNSGWGHSFLNPYINAEAH